LRAAVSSYPEIRPAMQFWEDEYNSVPSRGAEMDDAIQAKYVSRMIASNWAAGVPTFVWELVNDTSTDEGDDFGIIHGMMHKPLDFQPRPVFYAMQRINALLGDTQADPAISMKVLHAPSLDTASAGELAAYGFRSRSGKSIVTYWLAVKSLPEKPRPPVSMEVSLAGAGIDHPVLIDLDADQITALNWETSGTGRWLRVPVKDSVMAIADADYFDWPILPAAPSGLRLALIGTSTVLTWKPGDAYTTGFIIERRLGRPGKWTEIGQLSAATTTYEDQASLQDAFYRVRSVGGAGKSGYSNVVGGDLH
jgi:hypothetical protein